MYRPANLTRALAWDLQVSGLSLCYIYTHSSCDPAEVCFENNVHGKNRHIPSSYSTFKIVVCVLSLYSVIQCAFHRRHLLSSKCF